MSAIRLGIVGIGKIARDQHLPTLLADPAFDVVATAGRHGGIDGIPNHSSIGELIDGGHDLHAISLCTPPRGRHAQAMAAIASGLHVMLEKPPATSLGSAMNLVEEAKTAGVTLFASWHSRAAAAVAPARSWLTNRTIRSVRIEWLEDIREWHPGQDWILAPGGFGVFDPGINALSILTEILPDRVRIRDSRFDIPANRAAPIAATLTGYCGNAPLEAQFDFLEAGGQHWKIAIDTDAGAVELVDGGSRWSIDGKPSPVPATSEYPLLYKRFAHLIANGESDADLEPLRIVVDAFLQAELRQCEAFEF